MKRALSHLAWYSGELPGQLQSASLRITISLIHQTYSYVFLEPSSSPVALSVSRRVGAPSR